MNRGSVQEKYLEIQGKKKKNHFEVFIWKACKSSSIIMRYFWKYARMSICEVKEHLKKKFKIDNCINPNVGTNHTSRRFFTIRNDLMKDYKLQRVYLWEGVWIPSIIVYMFTSVTWCSGSLYLPLRIYFPRMVLKFYLQVNSKLKYYLQRLGSRLWVWGECFYGLCSISCW